MLYDGTPGVYSGFMYGHAFAATNEVDEPYSFYESATASSGSEASSPDALAKSTKRRLDFVSIEEPTLAGVWFEWRAPSDAIEATTFTFRFDTLDNTIAGQFDTQITIFATESGEATTDLGELQVWWARDVCLAVLLLHVSCVTAACLLHVSCVSVCVCVCLCVSLVCLLYVSRIWLCCSCMSPA